MNGVAAAPDGPDLSAVFRALGDPVRLEMVRRLSLESRAKLATLSHGLPITRQGARKHIQVLVDAGLVELHSQGRDVVAELHSETLDVAQQFLAALEAEWDKRLHALKSYVEAHEPPSG